MNETVFLNGSKKKVLQHARYTKEFGTGIFKTKYVIDRYDLDDGRTYIVTDTKAIERKFVKEKFNEFLKKFDIKVD